MEVKGVSYIHHSGGMHVNFVYFRGRRVNEEFLLPGYGNFQYNDPANGNDNYNPYGNAQYGAGYGGNYKNS